MAESRALRLANAVGRGLARVGIRASLEEESLLRAARRFTRLHDFGDEDFREPLRRLLAAHEEERGMSPVGRALKRLDFADMLATRLRVRHQVVRRPELVETPVRSPLIVTGLPRSGTTMLQRLLSLDPDARPLLSWEAMWPAPLPRLWRGEDPRIRYARRMVGLTRRFLPDVDRVHPLDPEGPEECTRLLESSFRWSSFGLDQRLPSYAAWVEEQSPGFMLPAYRWYATQLQVLQGSGNPGRWVLKSPHHVANLRALFDVLPDARVVLLVRDPREGVASTCSMYAFLGRASFDRIRIDRFGLALAESLARALTRGLQVAAEEPGRVRVVRYEDLIADPMGTVEDVHSAFRLPVSADFERAVGGWLAANPKGRHGVHTYDLTSYGIDEETVLRIFEPAELAMSRIGLSSRK